MCSPSAAPTWRCNFAPIWASSRPQKRRAPWLSTWRAARRSLIGRAPDNQIVLDHPQVCRYHAMIERMGTRYRINDLKSANGVFVNGKRIENEAWLKEGDEIRIGALQLQSCARTASSSTAEEGCGSMCCASTSGSAKRRTCCRTSRCRIYPQEFVALVGMSGSGKSTLMDAINGFRPATHGDGAGQRRRPLPELRPLPQRHGLRAAEGHRPPGADRLQRAGLRRPAAHAGRHQRRRSATSASSRCCRTWT